MKDIPQFIPEDVVRSSNHTLRDKLRKGKATLALTGVLAGGVLATVDAHPAAAGNVVYNEVVSPSDFQKGTESLELAKEVLWKRTHNFEAAEKKNGEIKDAATRNRNSYRLDLYEGLDAVRLAREDKIAEAKEVLNFVHPITNRNLHIRIDNAMSPVGRAKKLAEEEKKLTWKAEMAYENSKNYVNKVYTNPVEGGLWNLAQDRVFVFAAADQKSGTPETNKYIGMAEACADDLSNTTILGFKGQYELYSLTGYRRGMRAIQLGFFAKNFKEASQIEQWTEDAWGPASTISEYGVDMRQASLAINLAQQNRFSEAMKVAKLIDIVNIREDVTTAIVSGNTKHSVDYNNEGNKAYQILDAEDNVPEQYLKTRIRKTI